MKRISISISDWIFTDIVEKRTECMTRSEWIETLIVVGFKSRETSEFK